MFIVKSNLHFSYMLEVIWKNYKILPTTKKPVGWWINKFETVFIAKYFIQNY